MFGKEFVRSAIRCQVNGKGTYTLVAEDGSKPVELGAVCDELFCPPYNRGLPAGVYFELVEKFLPAV